MFRIITVFTFWVMRTRDIWNACLQTHRNNRLCLNVAYFLRKIKPSRVNNSRILSINTKSDNKTLNISRTKFIFCFKKFPSGGHICRNWNGYESGLPTIRLVTPHINAYILCQNPLYNITQVFSKGNIS